jgi:excisionase family DNA binding protein
MSTVPDTDIRVPFPGVGILKLTQDEFLRGLSRGAEVVPSYSNTPVEAAPDGGAPVQSAQLLDAAGLAAVLNVPVSWVETAARKGNIPSVRLGRWVRFSYDAVVAHAQHVGIPRLAAHRPVPPAHPKLPPAQRLRRKSSNGHGAHT